MNKYQVMQVDAFTTQPLAGNPCVVVFDADDLAPEKRLAIAKEINLSETAFVQDSAVADFGARYFTPAEEIPLAGHPTIATVFALIDSGRLRLEKEHTQITLELKVGVIPIDIYAQAGNVTRIVMSQKKPEFFETCPAEEVMPVFGLAPEDGLPGVPIQVVSTGTRQLMIPVRNLAALRRAKMDHRAYPSLREKYRFFSPHLFALAGVEQGDTFAVHFGTPPDLMEDPFTGSATGGMGAYLWHYGLLDSPNFIAEQGHWMGRPGLAYVEVVGPRADIKTVRVGGQAVTVLRGELVV